MQMTEQRAEPASTILVDIRDVYILPTIRISTQYEMIDKNFNIQIHFAVFHFRWRWVDG